MRVVGLMLQACLAYSAAGGAVAEPDAASGPLVARSISREALGTERTGMHSGETLPWKEPSPDALPEVAQEFGATPLAEAATLAGTEAQEEVRGAALAYTRRRGGGGCCRRREFFR